LLPSTGPKLFVQEPFERIRLNEVHKIKRVSLALLRTVTQVAPWRPATTDL